MHPGGCGGGGRGAGVSRRGSNAATVSRRAQQHAHAIRHRFPATTQRPGLGRVGAGGLGESLAVSRVRLRSDTYTATNFCLASLSPCHPRHIKRHDGSNRREMPFKLTPRIEHDVLGCPGIAPVLGPVQSRVP